MHRAFLLLVAALCSCKSRGTIELDFDPDGATCTEFSAGYWMPGGAGAMATCAGTQVHIDHYVLYAEADTTCNSCECGGCVGTGTKVVRVCPDDSGQSCGTDIQDLSLDLQPGLWAVVLEAYASAPQGSPPCLVANQCIEITVDADGTSSSMAGLAEIGGCQACAM